MAMYLGEYEVAVTKISGDAPNLQAKTNISPTTSSQTIYPDNGYDGLASVQINAMPSGTAGTPTASKGTVSNNSILVTPSVTNTTGYITGGTKTGTAVSVSASELVSGNKEITSNGTNIDVTNYATVSVAVGGQVSNAIYYENNQIGSSSWISASQEGNIVSILISGGDNIAPVYQAGYAATTDEIPVSIYATNTYTIPTVTLPTSTSESATSGYTLKATVMPSTSDQYINIGTGYNGTTSYYKINAMSTMTLPTTTSNSSSGTSKASFTLTAGTKYLNIPTGYNGTASYYTLTVASGSATGPSSITQSSATVSTGTNTLILTKTGVSTTPTVSAGYVSSATSSTATVTLTASVTTKAAATITPGTTDQTIASGTYLTGTQTISGDANLVAGNIKKNVTIFGTTGTYEGSGSSGGTTFDAIGKGATPSTTGSISFTDLLGEPICYSIICEDTIATGSPGKIAMIVYDGTTFHVQTITNTSNAQVTYVSGGSVYHNYSNGTLNVYASGIEFITGNNYNLIYGYGGDGSNIYTSDVQVGSGATSITFSDLEDEPVYFSCIFKSNFSTSSGYQRVIGTHECGGDIEGMEMDSSAKYSSSHWTYSYNNGSLTITSSGTNAGGYFHQPGYYQLTYAIASGSSDYQQKTVTPTTSQQVITADTGYLALSRVTVNAIPSSYVQPTSTVGTTTYRASTSNQTITSGTYHSGTATIAAVSQTNLSADNIKSGTTITISNGQSNLWSVTGTYTGSGGGSSSIGTKTVTASNRPTSLSFTSMLGQPIAFFLRCTSSMSRSSNSSYYYVATMRYNGTNTTGNCWRMSNGNWTNITSGYSYTYSGTTLTVSSSGSTTTSPGCFYPGDYELVYIY